ncbi:hypothetical protein CP10139811_0969 [Chlamydia ibidis]|uniref:Uncharacterized protein n=3 Tax=Chlamydia ibidis TaxID=1405396 RepID=S7KGU6_9CHLA|nr:hypothetical protein CP10139811_0969 [Chlamydia ibidis]EQM63235.1 hypothetical protein H359_0287 [Chlamydia ibidis 10-1398/6]
MLGKKLFCGWLRKSKGNCLPKEIEEILDENMKSPWFSKIICKTGKLAIFACLIWTVFRNRD